MKLPGPTALGGGCEQGMPPLDWYDPDLGVKVFVHQDLAGQDAGDRVSEVWAEVICDRPPAPGLAVFVALTGQGPDQMVRRTVRLDRPYAGGGSSGKVHFGSVKELWEELGGSMTVDAFLIEPVPPAPPAA